MEKTSPKFFCFVLMPFDSSFDDIYNYGIKESCKEADAYCERVDEQIFQETILDRIYNQIAKADLIIADMTGRNPNVFYEVGYAHALNKPTVLLTQAAEDIPFDLMHYPHIVYGGKIAGIREQLPKRIAWLQENVSRTATPYKIGIELYAYDKNLALEVVEIGYSKNRFPSFSFTIHNASTFTYQSGEFQIGVICEWYSFTTNQNIASTQMPDGRYIHMLPYFDQLFPGTYTSASITLRRYGDQEKGSSVPETFSVIVRVFTDAGSRDYNLIMKGVD